MRLRHLWLNDFRNYGTAELELAEGLTAVIGDNGEGKSNLLEAIGYLATLASFRGAPPDAMVRSGASEAVVRAEGRRAGRDVLVEARLSTAGRNRVQVNRQRLARARDLLGALRVSVFAPDDLALVKGGPGERRRYLDDALVALAPRNDAVRAEVERVLRQRNALLRQVAGRGGALAPEVEATLEVWDAKFVAAGEALASARAGLVQQLESVLAKAYRQLAGADADVTVSYLAPWREAGLAASLAQLRRDELRRGVTLVGPHRDDVVLTLNGLASRTHASQGEQRSLALALRLAAHAVVTDTVGEPPVLLLDDVFSELDADRSAALLAHLPSGQTVLTTAGGLPTDARPEQVVRVRDGRLT